MNLVDFLIQEGWLKTPRIIEAFLKIKRVDFMFTRRSPKGEGGPDAEELAEINEAFPIGYGQTISQPLTVAFILEQLQPEPGNKILDIGSGSGWTSALLAHIVSGGELKSKIKNQKSKMGGRVIAIEIVPELKKFGERNAAKYNFVERRIVEFICADASKGYRKEAPFDRILVSAAAEKVPPDWKEQLKIGGRIVTPVGNSIWTIIKKSESDFEEIEHPGFAFVPLVKQGA